MTEPSHPDQSALERVVEQAISLARARGATAAEAGVGVSTGLSVTVRLGEVETLEYQRDRSLGVTIYAGQRKGSASTANLSPAAVEETVAKALSIATFTAEDQYAGLPDAALMASNLPDLDLTIPGRSMRRPRSTWRNRRLRVTHRRAHPQIPRRLGPTAPEAAGVRQQPRICRRISFDFHSISCVVLG
jgi:PmbA protein